MSGFKTIPVGAVIEYNNRKFMVIDDGSVSLCKNCAFLGGCSNIPISLRGACDEGHRTDKKNVHFEEVKDKKPSTSSQLGNSLIAFSNLEKEEKLQYIHVGIVSNNDDSISLILDNEIENDYKILKVSNNSNTVKIVLAHKSLTYGDIVDALGDEAIKLPQGVTSNNSGTIIDNTIRLMNIANYYNGDWSPNWQDDNEPKYSICTNYKTDKKERSYFVITHTQINQSTVYFKHKEYAQAVIDNPNLVTILHNIFYNE